MTDKDPTEEQAVDSESQTENRAKVVWDDAAMRSAYANATNVAAGREEIVLLFGMNQSWQAGQKEIKVQLSDRVILTPHAARRLSALLNNALHNYERQFGTLQIGP